jgi:hypothetical protein
VVRPVDALLRDFVSKPARQAGFRKKSRTFVFGNANGDLVGFDFQGSSAQNGNAEFYINCSLWPLTWAEWVARQGEDRAYHPAVGLGHTRFRAPADVTAPGKFGRVDRFVIELDETTWLRKGTALQQFVTAAIVPYLIAWLDADLSADLCYEPSDSLGMRRIAYWRFFVLLNHGPSSDLAETWERLESRPTFDDEIAPWATSRLVERFGQSAAGWRDGEVGRWWEPARHDHRQLVAALGRQLLPAGFVFERGAFRQRNDYGDQVLVEIRPAATSTDSLFRFSVDTCFVPAMYWRFRRDTPRFDTGREPSSKDGWHQQRTSPPFTWAAPVLNTIADTLDHWAVAPGQIDDCATALAGELTPTLATLIGYLNRDELLATAINEARHDPHGLHSGGLPAELLLTLDRDPARARAVIAGLPPATASRETELIEWALAVLA